MVVMASMRLVILLSLQFLKNKRSPTQTQHCSTFFLHLLLLIKYNLSHIFPILFNDKSDGPCTMSHCCHCGGVVGDIFEPAVSTAAKPKTTTLLVITISAQCKVFGVLSLLINLTPLKIVHFLQVTENNGRF